MATARQMSVKRRVVRRNNGRRTRTTKKRK